MKSLPIEKKFEITNKVLKQYTLSEEQRQKVYEHVLKYEATDTLEFYFHVEKFVADIIISSNNKKETDNDIDALMTRMINEFVMHELLSNVNNSMCSKNIQTPNTDRGKISVSLADAFKDNELDDLLTVCEIINRLLNM